MKRWTIEDLEKTTDLKFAACILNERREGLNPYTPLSQKLEKAKNLILRMDGYAEGWGGGTEASTEDILKTLYRDGYHAAARRIENMLVDLKDMERERQLLDACFGYLAEALPKSSLLPVLRKEIGLTEQEIEKYQMEWLLEGKDDGEAKV